MNYWESLQSILMRWSKKMFNISLLVKTMFYRLTFTSQIKPTPDHHDFKIMLKDFINQEIADLFLISPILIIDLLLKNRMLDMQELIKEEHLLGYSLVKEIINNFILIVLLINKLMNQGWKKVSLKRYFLYCNKLNLWSKT